MSGKYDVLYRFEYGEPGIPDALEIRDYGDEPGYVVMKIAPTGTGCSIAWLADIDEARDFLLARIGGVIRCDKAVAEIDRRNEIKE